MISSEFVFKINNDLINDPELITGIFNVFTDAERNEFPELVEFKSFSRLLLLGIEHTTESLSKYVDQVIGEINDKNGLTSLNKEEVISTINEAVNDSKSYIKKDPNSVLGFGFNFAIDKDNQIQFHWNYNYYVMNKDVKNIH